VRRPGSLPTIEQVITGEKDAESVYTQYLADAVKA
jgi:hypothetical protein